MAEKGIPVPGVSKSNLALSLKVSSGLGPVMWWSWSELLVAPGLLSCETKSCSHRVADSQSLSRSPCRKSRRPKNPGSPELTLLGRFHFAHHSQSTSHRFIPKDIPFRLLLLPTYPRMFILKGKKRKPGHACVSVHCVLSTCSPGLYLWILWELPKGKKSFPFGRLQRSCLGTCSPSTWLGIPLLDLWRDTLCLLMPLYFIVCPLPLREKIL